MEVGKGYVVWRVGGRGSILKRGIKIPLRGRKKHVCDRLELLKILLFKDSSFFMRNYCKFFSFVCLKIAKNWKFNKNYTGLRRRITSAVVCYQNLVISFYRTKDEVDKLMTKMINFWWDKLLKKIIFLI